MKQIFKVFCIILMLAGVFALAACQDDRSAQNAGKSADQTTGKPVDQTTSKPVDQTAEKVGDKMQNAGDYMDDTAITAKVKADILQDPLLKVFEIDVVTTDGVVKLGGTVDTKTSFERATEISRSVKDVKSVQNNLVVKQ